MIRITKDEANYLRKYKNIGNGENGIIATSGHTKNHYLTETKNNMAALREYRNRTIK